MTLTALKGGSWMMGNGTWFPSSNTSNAMTASGHRVMAVIGVPYTGNLRRIRFRTGTVTTGDTVRVSFQDVSATTGLPDGTQDQYRDVTVNSTDDDTWIQTGDITATGADGGGKRSVTRGDVLAVVWEFPSYVAGNLNIRTASPHQTADNCFYVGTYNGTSWTVASGRGEIELEYDDGTIAYTPSMIPAEFTSGTIASNTTPDEIGNYFEFPAQVKVGGVCGRLDLDGDCDVVLYDSDGTTVLASVSLDKDLRNGTVSTPFERLFSGEVTLAANTRYRLVYKPTSTTAVGYRRMDVPAAGTMAAFPLGTSCYMTSRTDAGSWSETTTARIQIDVLITQIHDGSGSGGPITSPGMSGGMRT